MKRSALLCLSLLSLIFAAQGCQQSEDYIYTCGNGTLEEDEVCDGSIFSAHAQMICANGSVPDTRQVRCTSNCTLDMTWACLSGAPTCGNGQLDPNEQCDGLILPQVTANCEQPDMTKLTCVNCLLQDTGVCPQTGTSQNPGDTTQNPNHWVPQTCGNKNLDDGEWCDGDLIADAAKTCPENMALKANPVFKCLDSCRLVDVRNACEYKAAAYCGNGIRENDEQCDGTDFNSDLTGIISCKSNENKNLDNVSCTDKCTLDTSKVCTPKIRYDVGVLITEVVPHLHTTSDAMSIDGLAFELTNMDTKNYDLSACSLALIAESGIKKKYTLASLNISSLEAYESTVICSYSTTNDLFNGACNAVIADDTIQKNIAGVAYIGLVCGADDQVIDLFNYNSFTAAIQYGGVDFVRTCDAEPATNSQNALLGTSWVIDSATTYAPNYGLGSHCENIDSGVASCTYTANRTTLDNRGQTIELALEIHIPGLSDKTEKTDVSTSTLIQFTTGKITDQTVSEEIIHMAPVKPDTEWINNNGIDRYIGTLRNWDTYEGFLSYEAGTYTLDASISFDSGKTRIYCGPKGILRNYETYVATERNTLTVSYDDNGGVCGDGIITASELCEGTTFRDEVLECEKPGEVIVNPAKAQCSSCTMVSTAKACGQKPDTCGNNIIESPEVCDGTQVPDALKVCPTGMVERQDATWTCQNSCMSILTNTACEPSCGNGRLDNSVNEICDGNLYDHTAAAQKCGTSATYDQTRATCSELCMPESAACVPNTHLTIDEFIVQTQGNTPNAVAFSLKYNGTDPLDVTHCTLSFIDKNNKIIATPNYTLAYFDFASMMQATETPVYLEPCQSLVVCSEPAQTQADYQNVFQGKCDAHLSLVDTSATISNPFIEYADKIAHLQLTCGGEFIDFLDYQGLVNAMNAGYTHGKLKAEDPRPWPSRTSVKLENRMDLDKTYNLADFAADTCE